MASKDFDSWLHVLFFLAVTRQWNNINPVDINEISYYAHADMLSESKSHNCCNSNSLRLRCWFEYSHFPIQLLLHGCRITLYLLSQNAKLHQLGTLVLAKKKKETCRFSSLFFQRDNELDVQWCFRMISTSRSAANWDRSNEPRTIGYISVSSSDYIYVSRDVDGSRPVCLLRSAQNFLSRDGDVKRDRCTTGSR